VKRIVFITARESEYGFGLAGVTHYTSTPEELEERLREVLDKEDTGIVVLEEQLAKGISEERLRQIDERWHGILLILPSPEEYAGEEDYAQNLIRKAIGYHVRLRL
jgi:vacuolar-type H+-ATPase subunit F/Vma7